MRRDVLIVFVFFISWAACSSPKQNNDIYVFTASGARLPTDSISKAFQSEINKKVNVNFASSGILARQIENGAEAHLFISANKKWIDYLANKGLLDNSSIKAVGKNRLVVVAPHHSLLETLNPYTDLDTLTQVFKKIVIGNPNHVPVGRYSKQALERLSWYSRLKEVTIQAKDVSSVLQYVEMGECDWGIVYASEARNSYLVKVIDNIPEHFHDPIVFYIAKTTTTHKDQDALYEQFINDTGQDIFATFGFQTTTK